MAFLGAIAAALASVSGDRNKGTMVAAYGNNPNVSGNCNVGTLVESGCTTSVTVYPTCTVQFTGTDTKDVAKNTGCVSIFYKSSP